MRGSQRMRSMQPGRSAEDNTTRPSVATAQTASGLRRIPEMGANESVPRAANEVLTS